LTSNMFSFITKTWNPLGGECEHKCDYCWAQGPNGLSSTNPQCRTKYQGPPDLKLPELKRRFRPDDFIFVEDMGDLFGEWVPNVYIEQVLARIRDQPKTQFLLMTKNPRRYYFLARNLPSNAVLGCTIESNRNYLLLSRAPKQTERLQRMYQLKWDGTVTGHLRRFISVEPILDFDLPDFSNSLIELAPWAIAIGYDNYEKFHAHLPEPFLAKTLHLIDDLENAGIMVYRKTLREMVA
jgi:protein gp37